MTLKNKTMCLTVMAVALVSATASGGILKGRVIDSETREPLIGAVVKADADKKGTVTDINGCYTLTLPEGQHEINVSYIGYPDTAITATLVKGDTVSPLDIVLTPDATSLSEVVVTADAAKNTEASVIEEEKESEVVQSGVSAQQIAKTQDKDASEVIRRVPGISIIDDKFVMVRGLSQRYNNVWLNGSAVPSSEADSRAFFFRHYPLLAARQHSHSEERGA